MYNNEQNNALNEKSLMRGIVTKGVGGLYGVRLVCSNAASNVSTADVTCRARGHFRHEGMSPLPGDDVLLSELISPDGKEYVIEDILDRSSDLIRPPMANLSHLFLLIPSCRPTPDLTVADKLTAIAEASSTEPVIIVGKSDLDPQRSLEIEKIYRRAGFNAFRTSAATGEGVEEISNFIDRIASEGEKNARPVRAAFAGVSGAGKSTLISALFPTLELAAGTLSRKTERGRHTTRHVEMFPLKSLSGYEFYLADTPGFSMIDFTRFNFFGEKELAGNFREFAECIGQCRYTKCTHTKEEGCTVLEKLNRGEISPTRHESYRKIFEELKKKPEWKRQKEESAESSAPKRRARRR